MNKLKIQNNSYIENKNIRFFWNYVPSIAVIFNIVVYRIISHGSSGYFELLPNEKDILLLRVVISFATLVFTAIGIAKTHKYWKILSVLGFIITFIIFVLSLFAYGVTR